jgi:hypothetical protein
MMSLGDCTGSRLVWAGLVLGTIGLAMLVGCGSEPYSMVQVTGKVTYEDGSVIPAKRLRVVFVPQAQAVSAAVHPRPGEAEVNVADGVFQTVTSHKYGDGLVIGKHKVQVISLDENETETNAVPKEYRNADTTPLEVEVGSGKTEIELKVKKP